MAALSTPTAKKPRQLVEQVIAELRALSTVQDRLDQYAAGRFGLNRTDLRALDLIGQAQAISPTALATALGMSTGATSTVLDRLERAGYAARGPDPQHRRRTLVRMTAHAHELSTAIFGPVLRGTAEQAASCSDTALADIAGFLADHRAVLDHYLATTDHDSNGNAPDADGDLRVEHDGDGDGGAGDGDGDGDGGRTCPPEADSRTTAPRR